MYCLHLGFKNKNKKITIAKNINTTDLANMIKHSFKLSEQIIGLTNSKGHFISLDQLQKSSLIQQKDILYLVTTQDVNQDNMSFASDHYDRPQKNQNYKKNQMALTTQDEQSELPSQIQGFYQGVIGNLQIFQQLLLQDNEATVVFCFVKEKPKNINFPYYLYHTSKNSAIVYVGHSKVCEFYIQNMNEIPKEIQLFIRSIIKCDDKKRIKNQKELSQNERQDDFNDLLNDVEHRPHNPFQQQYNQIPLQLANNEQELQIPLPSSSSFSSSKQQTRKQQQMRSSLLQNLLKLRDDEQITELQFYKMKSQLLESMSDFMRKYQMGTRKGFRNNKNQINRNGGKGAKQFKGERQGFKQIEKIKNTQKQRERERFAQKQPQRQKQRKRTPQSKNQYRPTYSRQTKKYQIPIIVRKYNNVIQKISTSYPLTHEQQQAINLILQLELKGLISEKESGVYKTSILQQDPDIFPLFLDYFDGLLDQIELVSKLKKIKKINSQKKQRGEHNMRLLIKYSKQSNYEVLRNLLLEKNQNLMNSLERYRVDRNAELLAGRLEKIAEFEKQKMSLQNILN